ncbi:hypothetical protein SBRCBS47491_002657 [Sporothrix bragantina]|uniref:Aldehyde dehydrogenase domain-containing protein n=1 Tax=Sporothrix bragantina TaxID=671064 RepID=A0ABP0B9N7_9PEZI
MDDVLRVYDAVLGARREGRLENEMQRKYELQCIFQAIKAAVPRLVEANLSDCPQRSEASVLLECTATLRFLREIHDRLSLADAIERERHPERGLDDTRRVLALGVVVILAAASPTSSSIAHAVIPLAAAIAAGNTPILVLDPRSGKTSHLLYDSLRSSGVDRDAIGLLMPGSHQERRSIITSLAERPLQAIVVQTEDDLSFVNSETSLLRATPTCRVISALKMPVVVTITRQGNVDKAAVDVLRAASLTDRHVVVLVDEAVLATLQTALQRRVHAYVEANKSKHQRTKRGDKPKLSDGSLTHWTIGQHVHAVVGEASIETIQAVIQSHDEEYSAISILTTSSMDAALSIVDSITIPNTTSYPSVHIYSIASEARYLSRFMDTASTFVNQIPVLACIAPPQHSFLDVVLETLYSRPSPLQVRHQPSGDLGSAAVSASQLRALVAYEQLAIPTRPAGKRMGFFPQGGLVGLSHLLLITASLGWVAWATARSRWPSFPRAG